MKKLGTIHSYGTNTSFYIPLYSVVKKILFNNDIVTLIYEYDDIHTDLKCLNVKITNDIEFCSLGYEYFDSIYCSNPILLNNSSVSGNNINLSLNINNDGNIHHIFIDDIKSKEELRDSKIESVLDNN